MDVAWFSELTFNSSEQRGNIAYLLETLSPRLSLLYLITSTAQFLAAPFITAHF